WYIFICFFFSSRRRHTSFSRDWSSDVCSSDLPQRVVVVADRDAVPCRDRRGRVEARRGLGDLVGGLPVLGGVVRVDHGRHADLRSEERRVGKGGRYPW